MNYLEEIIRALDLDAELLPADENIIDAHIRFEFPCTHMDRNFELIVTVQPSSFLQGVIEIEDADVDLIQILCAAPRVTNEKFLEPTLRMIQIYNKLSPIPGFGIDEVDRRLFFRYAIPVHPDTINPTQLKHTILSVEQIIDLYMTTIEDVSQGVVDLDELMEEAQRKFVDDHLTLNDLFEDEGATPTPQ